MNIVRSILHDLVEKKLWPVAAILVALLVAVPMTLAKPGDPPPAAAIPTNLKSDDTGPTLALTRSSLTGFARSPRVNDRQLDPFASRSRTAIEKALAALNKSVDTVISNGGTSGDTGVGGGTPYLPSDSGSSPSPPTGSDPTKPPKVETEEDDVLSILVTQPEGEPVQLDGIRTLSPLPDAENPFLVYVGKAGNDKATFLVSADVTVSSTSDGECAPTPQDCRTLTLSVGETADFTLLLKDNAKVSVTVLEVETKNVPVSGDEDTATAAGLEAQGRTAGATALKAALKDESVAESLIANKVKIRK